MIDLDLYGIISDLSPIIDDLDDLAEKIRNESENSITIRISKNLQVALEGLQDTKDVLESILEGEEDVPEE